MKIIQKGDTVIFNKVCTITKKLYEVQVDYKAVDTWRKGTLIHKAFPNLNSDDREFLISGFTPSEWEEVFKDEE